MTGLFTPLSAESRTVLDRIPNLFNKVFPVPGRFSAALPDDVAELSRLLTAGRADRGVSYLGKPALLSAYLRYFMPWNIFRLCRLFAFLPLKLKDNDAINDLGAGPFTFASALWISRKDLRKLHLEFRCVDRTPAVLEAGKKFFTALAAETGGENCPWEFRTIRGELMPFGSRRRGCLSVEIHGKSAALSAAVNVYNELFWNLPPADKEGLLSFTEAQADLLSSLTENDGAILVAEPGIPRSGEFISLLRQSLMERGRNPLSPCVHSAACPITGKGNKAKWCHFAFDTGDAPGQLHKLSAAAKIPKERAVLSYLFAGPKTEIDTKVEKITGNNNTHAAKLSSGKPVKIRVISDAFAVQDSWGRYGCSENGMVLVTGNRTNMNNLPSASLLELPLDSKRIDNKSGAYIAEYR